MELARMLPRSIQAGELPSAKTIYGEYLHLAIPSVAEMVLTTLISMFDTMMVSGLGTDAVAAVGITAQPKFLMLCFFFALNTGITAVVARRKGECRTEEMNRVVRNSILLIIGLSAILMTLMLIFIRPLMVFAGADVERTLDDAVDYLTILTWCLPIQTLTLGLCAAQRGIGKTKLTLYVNIVSNLVNIMFNWLLINGIGPFPRLGIRGAAIATNIGQTVGFLLVLFVYIRGNVKGSELHLSLKDDWKPNRNTIADITKVASGSMVEQLACRFGFFTFAKIVASLGTDAFAAHQIACQFLSISFSFADGCAIAGTSLVGQKLGAKRKDLAFLFGKLAQKTAFFISILLALVCIVLRKPLVGLYISENATPGVDLLAQNLMFAVAMIQPLQMVAVVTSGALRGAGDIKYTAKVATISIAIVRTVVAYSSILIFEKGLEMHTTALYGVWFSTFTDLLIRYLSFKKRYNKGSWCEIKV